MQTIIKRNGKKGEIDYLIDDRLSWAAKGIIAYVQPFNESMEINLSKMQTESIDGKDEFYRALKELFNMGYCQKLSKVDDKGEIIGWIYAISGYIGKQKRKEKPKDSEIKTLFSNSDVYKLVKFENENEPDYSEFEEKFGKNVGFEQIDLVYYFHVVNDWSYQKNMKRTANGWMATIRNFIRSDMSKNRLKLKPEYQQERPKMNIGKAVDFLNEI